MARALAFLLSHPGARVLLASALQDASATVLGKLETALPTGPGDAMLGSILAQNADGSASVKID